MKGKSSKQKRDQDQKGAKALRDACRGHLRCRRVWLTPAEDIEFDRLISPLGTHITQQAAALERLDLYQRKRRVVGKGAKADTPVEGSSSAPSIEGLDPKPATANADERRVAVEAAMAPTPVGSTSCAESVTDPDPKPSTASVEERRVAGVMAEASIPADDLPPAPPSDASQPKPSAPSPSVNPQQEFLF